MTKKVDPPAASGTLKGYDPTKALRAFKIHEPSYVEMAPDEVLERRPDMFLAAAVSLAALPRLMSEVKLMKALPGFEVRNVTDLEELTLAACHA
ncbi:MAG: hypothetical protein HY901_35065, partial [Deltaproteobacteria bacterium]|nr:hypothetical protein [Deltaproteobacteria bacterium]